MSKWECEGYVEEYGVKVFFVTPNDSDEVIAEVFEEGHAHLISAAPDMLEALEGAKRVVDEIYKHPEFSDYLAGHPRPVQDAINAAISKAKGEGK